MNSDLSKDRQSAGGLTDSVNSGATREIAVALLTGGGDKPYVFGLTRELISKGAEVDLIGSDELDCPEFHNVPRLHFLNLRGDQRTTANLPNKVLRVLKYYAKLMRYAAKAKPRIFHILWNNKFQYLDRTLLIYYYKLLGKKVVLTVHNVNIRRRDRTDSPLNRLTLRIQYRLADHMFVHTDRMKSELIEDFGANAARISVIPFGINNAVPHTDLTPGEARKRLGLRNDEKAILFFGRITPYKGLEYLVAALKQILLRRSDYRLIIAGRPEVEAAGYWANVLESVREETQKGQVIVRGNFIPDEETEVYFKAADVLVLPYRNIYQSGVLFLGHSFGLPVLAADIGSLSDDIVEGKTGYVFKAEDAVDLKRAIETYFSSDLYSHLSSRRGEIQNYAARLHSWDTVGQTTMRVYAGLVGASFSGDRGGR